MKLTESLQVRDMKSFKIFCNKTRRSINLVNVSSLTLFPDKLNTKWKGTAIRNETSDKTCYHEGLSGWFGDWICLNYQKRDNRSDRSYSGIFFSQCL